MALRTLDEQAQRRQRARLHVGKNMEYGVMQGRRPGSVWTAGQLWTRTRTAADAVHLAAVLPEQTSHLPLARQLGPDLRWEEWDLRNPEHRASLAHYLWSARKVRWEARRETRIITSADAALAARIREVRRARVLTQQDLAARMGVPQSAIARWESGTVAGIRPTTIRRLAVALDVAPETLTGGVGAALGRFGGRV